MYILYFFSIKKVSNFDTLLVNIELNKIFPSVKPDSNNNNNIIISNSTYTNNLHTTNNIINSNINNNTIKQQEYSFEAFKKYICNENSDMFLMIIYYLSRITFNIRSLYSIKFIPKKEEKTRANNSNNSYNSSFNFNNLVTQEQNVNINPSISTISNKNFNNTKVNAKENKQIEEEELIIGDSNFNLAKSVLIQAKCASLNIQNQITKDKGKFNYVKKSYNFNNVNNNTSSNKNNNTPDINLNYPLYYVKTLHKPHLKQTSYNRNFIPEIKLNQIDNQYNIQYNNTESNLPLITMPNNNRNSISNNNKSYNYNSTSIYSNTENINLKHNSNFDNKSIRINNNKSISINSFAVTNSISNYFKSHNTMIKTSYDNYNMKMLLNNSKVIEKINDNYLKERKKEETIKEILTKDMDKDVPILSSKAEKLYNKYTLNKKKL